VKRAVRFIHTWILLSLFPQMPSGVFLEFPFTVDEVYKPMYPVSKNKTD